MIAASASIPSDPATIHLYTNYDDTSATNYSGFDFSKFTYDTNGSVDYSTSDRLDNSRRSYLSGDTITLYAQWNPKLYNVEIVNSTDTSKTLSIPDIPYNDVWSQTLSGEAVEAAGKSFKGLSRDSAEGSTILYNLVDNKVAFTRLSEDYRNENPIVLYSQFDTAHYPIYYKNSDDGSDLIVDTNIFPTWYTVDGTVEGNRNHITTIPVRSGYNFLGWKYSWGDPTATHSEINIPMDQAYCHKVT